MNKPLAYRYRPELDPASPEYDEEAVRIDQEWHQKMRWACRSDMCRAFSEATKEFLKEKDK